ncbi:hypothetical protein [Mucilaginibacter glaciei]|uniref:Uncharacterized protein n=1 Tax=Mucilaginibacter glaciei TaxID=2772109 RepID=A0A926NI53_9SPHI|nr:hypothetical protein [Mucilaginibacter glaciei]MBD1391686.1 hypothetical protein [Mucilaginibacter glaciei]
MKNTSSIKYLLTVVFILTAGFFNVNYAQQKFDKTEFYATMSQGDLPKIESELEMVKASSLANKDGYEGALLMRKAGLVHGPKKKLGFFKEGRIKLETAIIADADNTEFRFLRLAIEENAPKIVKYKADIEKDKLFIQKNFKSQPQTVQHAIMEYCKKSKVLHAEDL